MVTDRLKKTDSKKEDSQRKKSHPQVYVSLSNVIGIAGHFMILMQKKGKEKSYTDNTFQPNDSLLVEHVLLTTGFTTNQ